MFGAAAVAMLHWVVAPQVGMLHDQKCILASTQHFVLMLQK